jgi:hypothetical protein
LFFAYKVKWFIKKKLQQIKLDWEIERRRWEYNCRDGEKYWVEKERERERERERDKILGCWEGWGFWAKDKFLFISIGKE